MLEVANTKLTTLDISKCGFNGTIDLSLCGELTTFTYDYAAGQRYKKADDATFTVTDTSGTAPSDYAGESEGAA